MVFFKAKESGLVVFDAESQAQDSLLKSRCAGTSLLAGREARRRDRRPWIEPHQGAGCYPPDGRVGKMARRLEEIAPQQEHGAERFKDEETGALQAGGRVFQSASGEEQALNPEGANPLHTGPDHRQKDNHHQHDRHAIAPAMSEQSHHALVVLRVGVGVRPVMKLRAYRHRHHNKQLRHQQRHNGAPESETLEAEDTRHHSDSTFLTTISK